MSIEHDVQCGCMEPAGRWNFEETRIGIDKTKGRYGEVSIRQCKECNNVWLHYQVEYEAFSKSGRWFRGLISPDLAKTTSPETAVQELAQLEWYFYGGSRFGHSGERAQRPLNPRLVDLP